MAQIKNVTELDFDQIKTNLKVFLSSQEKFNDYDFDGAGLNVLFDILSYNTQYNALLAHMSMNEAFLDSAQIRSNAVSHAKNLVYIPQSNRSAQAHMKITVTGDSDSSAELQIPKGTTFTGQIGSNTYTFVTNNSFLAAKQSLNNTAPSSRAEAGGVTTFTLDLAAASLFGTGALAENVKVEVTDGSSPYQTVFAEVTRSGSASMAIAFTGSIANDAYKVLLSQV